MSKLWKEGKDDNVGRIRIITLKSSRIGWIYNILSNFYKSLFLDKDEDQTTYI